MKCGIYFLVCLLVLTVSSLGLPTVVNVDSNNGTNDPCCGNISEPCRSLVYALSHTDNNVIIALLSPIVPLNTSIEIYNRRYLSIIGQGRDNTIIQCG